MALSGLLPDAPTPPNPMQTASAQTGTNVSTAIANSYLGNVNQNTPYGNLTNDVTGTYTFTDPTSGQSYNIPRWTTTQSLTPTGQQALGQTQGAQLNLATMANQQSGTLKNLLGSYFNPEQGGNFNAGEYLRQYPDVAAAAPSEAARMGITPEQYAALHWREFGANEGRMASAQQLPGMADMNLLNQIGFARGDIDPTAGYQTGYGSGGDVASGYGLGGDITRSYGPQDNFSADRLRIEQGLMERLNPQLQLENQRVQQQLADQGIRQGYNTNASTPGAYNQGMDVYNRMANDARLGVIAQGGAEQQRLNEMARNQAAFQNMAQAQANQQNAALAAFGNQAQQQREQQAAARGAFYNQAAESQFGQAAQRAGFGNQAIAQNSARNQAIFAAQNAQRNQALQEMYQQRQQPINEISALMSGSQVQQPSWINAARTQIPTTDVAGLINQNFAQQNDIYKTGTQFWGDIFGGALGAAGNIGGAAYLRSDRDVKEDIDRLGSVFSENGNKLPIYRYSYKDDPSSTRHVGPMAQDVEKIDPAAVRKIDGVKHINVDRLGSIFGRA